MLAIAHRLGSGERSRHAAGAGYGAMNHGIQPPCLIRDLPDHGFKCVSITHVRWCGNELPSRHTLLQPLDRARDIAA